MEIDPGLRQLNAKQVAAQLGIGVSTWWMWIHKGIAPKGVLLGPNTRRWPAKEIEAFVAERRREETA